MTIHVEPSTLGDMQQSFYDLGLAYSTGREGRVDLIEAHKWFNIAAAGGDRTAAERREEVASEMSRDEIAAALKAAREWISLH